MYCAACATSSPSPTMQRLPPGLGAIVPTVAGSRRPLATAVALTTAMLLLLRAFADTPLSGPATLLLAAPALIAYMLGTKAGVAGGITGVALMSLGLQAVAGSFNPPRNPASCSLAR